MKTPEEMREMRKKFGLGEYAKKKKTTNRSPKKVLRQKIQPTPQTFDPFAITIEPQPWIIPTNAPRTEFSGFPPEPIHPAVFDGSWAPLDAKSGQS